MDFVQEARDGKLFYPKNNEGEFVKDAAGNLKEDLQFNLIDAYKKAVGNPESTNWANFDSAVSRDKHVGNIEEITNSLTEESIKVFGETPVVK